MWEHIKRVFAKGVRPLESDVDMWFVSQATTVGTLVRLQLEKAGRTPVKEWQQNRTVFLGYTCGMTEHICAKLDMRNSAGGMALVALAGLLESAATPDQMLEACVSLQQAQDPTYVEAHRVGWHDLGTLSPSGLPSGLVRLLS